MITFETSCRAQTAWDASLLIDLQFLLGIRVRHCAHGAATTPIYPFICDISPSDLLLTGSRVLEALRVRSFRSAHTSSLDAVSLPYSGYHPYTDNDEIHSDEDQQYIFPNADPRFSNTEQIRLEPWIEKAREQHKALKAYVRGGQIWYALLHGVPKTPGGYVVLLAIGESPHGSRLTGVITHQVCHNLCD